MKRPTRWLRGFERNHMVLEESARPIGRRVLNDMADAMAHRGPDAEGFWTAPGVGLAHRRLSIIDLAGGDQPTGNKDGAIQGVINDEISKYPELQSRGHRFRRPPRGRCVVKRCSGASASTGVWPAGCRMC